MYVKREYDGGGGVGGGGRGGERGIEESLNVKKISGVRKCR